MLPLFHPGISKNHSVMLQSQRGKTLRGNVTPQYECGKCLNRSGLTHCGSGTSRSDRGLLQQHSGISRSGFGARQLHSRKSGNESLLLKFFKSTPLKFLHILMLSCVKKSKNHIKILKKSSQSPFLIVILVTTEKRVSCVCPSMNCMKHITNRSFVTPAG
jgi:hypothetical protein